jgi:hypothetical protein
MSRWNPADRAQPEAFVEISPELAAEKRIGNRLGQGLDSTRQRARQARS